MRTFYKTFTRLTAAALLVAMMAAPGLAAKSTPATDKNVNVPAVPRAIPDLVPYHNFDPPAGAVFDATKLTISGDMRVRPEYRNNNNLQHSTQSNPDNAFFTQQLIRLGFHYEISPDVVFFLQPQVSNNFGATDSNIGGTNFNPGGPGNSGTNTNLFLRQGFMLVRNFLIPNLSLKAGRQLVVWGNHRIFGHFDWNNVGFAFDGVTMRYNHAQVPVELGWLVVAEGNCNQNAGGCGTTGANNGDANILFARLPMKFGPVAVEPAWILEEGGAGSTNPVGGQQSDQTRHTLGARVALKQGMVDATTEGYYQFGSIGNGGNGSAQTINAFAFHLDGGVTMPVPMQPRVGAEFNYASGSDNSSGNNRHTFSQLFPTNHIHFGYMDLMSWQNMLTYGGNLQMRPTADSHFEISGTAMRLAQEEDCWYGAAQGCIFNAGQTNDQKSLGWELDVVYTLFFQNNKVGWQFGYGHFFTGDYISKNDKGNGTGSFANAADQNWGYTQLWINF